MRLIEIIEYKEHHIYLDLDGVIVNWEKGFEDLIGVPFNRKEYSTKEGRSKYIKQIEAAGTDFWSNLKPYDDYLDIINLVLSYDKDFEILTAPMMEFAEICIEGKKLWLDKYLPQYKHRANFCPSKEKWLYAKSDVTNTACLIDDSELNIKDWYEKGGCEGILYKNYYGLKKQLRQLFGG